MIVKINDYFPEEDYVGGDGCRDSVFSVTWDVLTAVLLKIKTLGHFYVKPISSYRRFGRIIVRHLQCKRTLYWECLTLKAEALRSIETLATLYKSSRSNILEELNLKCALCEKRNEFLNIIDLEFGPQILKHVILNIVKCQLLKI